jgi:putative membrane protein
VVLARFGVGPADLLGWGGESQVYALDASRVLRVYWPGAQVVYLDRRRAFYDLLALQRLPFELPVVLESGSLGDRLYTVERRMPGRVLADVLPSLRGADRERALASYLRAAELIGTVELAERPFGEILTAGELLQRDSWPEYLWDRLQQSYRLSRPDLERDAPEIDAILANVRSELRALEGFAERRLVHGDYFPGNVYVDDDLEVSGVGDFGYSTVVGDPRLDLAGAVAFLEVVDGYQAEDSAYLAALLEERRGSGLARWLGLYRLYYSLYFSTCRLDDPPTYAWCVRNLRAWRDER